MKTTFESGSPATRRAFLREVGAGTLTAVVGPSLAAELGFAPQAAAEEGPKRISLGRFEALADLMEQTPLDKLQQVLLHKLQAGTPLNDLLGSAALANARRFGGEDYIGFHTFMAMRPALEMAKLMPPRLVALPVLKVLYRNTSRLQGSGIATDALSPLNPPQSQISDNRATIPDLIRSREKNRAEQNFAHQLEQSAERALESLVQAVCDNPEVHRTVLPFRAWDMAQLVGPEHGLTLLRQSLRYCLYWERARKPEWDAHGSMLTRMLDTHHLHDFKPGSRPMEDGQLQELTRHITHGSSEDAAGATAAALAAGFDPAAIGEALSLACSRLVLVDPGRLPQYESPGKPAGCVHGDSMGVHASDAANAWRNLAKVGSTKYAATCLIMGAWVTARETLHTKALPEPLPPDFLLKGVKGKDASTLTQELREAIVDNQQAHAAAVVARMGELKVPDAEVFSCLLHYAVSEDGALHAEKYFHTVRDDFQSTRSSLRWQHLTALARVTASEYGRPAPGQAEARALLGKI